MKRTIGIVACLDTKGREVAFAKEMIERMGHSVLLIDVGVKLSPTIMPDIFREEVAEAADEVWETVKNLEKHRRINTMINGITRLVPRLYGEGRLHALLSIGGLQNTTIGTRAMQSLPLGVPKVMVSTIVSGQRMFEPYVGTKDVTLMHSVVDISGINSVTKVILGNAVGAIVGMSEQGEVCIKAGDKKIIGATMLGVTNDGVTMAANLVEERGWEVLTFHANGVGGRAMEELIDQGVIGAVMDLTLHEIASELYGGICIGANHRLDVACRLGIPQVVSPGGADFVAYHIDSLMPDWASRKCIYQLPTVLHLKLHVDEAMRVAEVIANRLNVSRGPVTILIPLRGFHQASFPGGPLWDPQIDQAFIETFRRILKPEIQWKEVDANINDPEFGHAAAESLIGMLENA